MRVYSGLAQFWMTEENSKVSKVRRKTGIQEVAKAAGVSIATVSRVANGNESVSPDLRTRVKKAASELKFNLNGKGKAKMIAFVLSNRNVFNSFHAAVMVGAEAYCASHDCGLLFLPIQYASNVPAQNLHLPTILQDSSAISAVIVAGTNSQNLLDLLTRRGFSLVVLGNNVVGEWRKDEYNAVYFDDLEGAYDATRYLQSLGHRQIWYVGNRRLPWFESRYQGYRRAMEEAGLPLLLNDFDSGDPEDVGYLATKSILKSGEPVTAIFAGEDVAARGAYKAIHESGLKIPDDISVVGFNDNEAAALNPPLTTVRVFTEQLGRRMAAVVLERLGHSDLGPEVITIPTQLVKRESCLPILQTETATKADLRQVV